MPHWNRFVSVDKNPSMLGKTNSAVFSTAVVYMQRFYQHLLSGQSNCPMWTKSTENVDKIISGIIWQTCSACGHGVLNVVQLSIRHL